MSQKTLEKTKTCSGCEAPLPCTLEHFGSAPKNRDGLTGRCRECLRVRYRARYAKTQEVCLAAQRRYKEKNQEKLAAYAREYAKRRRAEDPEGARIKSRQNSRLYKKQHPERVLEYSRRSYRKRGRWRELEKRYGISKTEFEQMATKQQDNCLLCEKPPGMKGLVVDHSHETGAIRGLLCGKCISVIGLVDESVATLERIIGYIRHHHGKV